MAGIDPITGAQLDEIADIKNSIADIVKTPVGSRIMRRDYGSHCANIVDSPGNEAGALRLIAAAADGIARWERRVAMKSARVVPAFDGSAQLVITAAIRGSDLTVTATARVGS